jgi:hypothetical protein
VAATSVQSQPSAGLSIGGFLAKGTGGGSSAKPSFFFKSKKKSNLFARLG